MFPFAHQLSGAKQQPRALLGGNMTPGLKSFISLFNRLIREFFRGFVKLSYYLRSSCRVDALERAAGLADRGAAGG